MDSFYQPLSYYVCWITGVVYAADSVDKDLVTMPFFISNLIVLLAKVNLDLPMI